jgi:hypothetical protein
VTDEEGLPELEVEPLCSRLGLDSRGLCTASRVNAPGVPWSGSEGLAATAVAVMAVTLTFMGTGPADTMGKGKVVPEPAGLAAEPLRELVVPEVPYDAPGTSCGDVTMANSGAIPLGPRRLTATRDPPGSLSGRKPLPNWLGHLVGFRSATLSSGAGGPAIGSKRSTSCPSRQLP